MSKRILILGAGLEQEIAIVQAKLLNYFVIACDSNPLAPGLRIADKVEVCDITNVEEILNIAKLENADGVFCHGVEIPHVVSQVTSALNLPGLEPEVAKICLNKSERIMALRKAGIPVADFAVVDDEHQLFDVAVKFGYPLVLKPVDNAGSRGVQTVFRKENLLAAYKDAMRFTNNLKVIFEKLLEGPQISTETFVYNGQSKTFAFADRNYNNDDFFAPYFIEDGINFPSFLPSNLQSETTKLVEKTISVLGIKFGAAKGDVIIHDGAPHIIEMASRTSGGWFSAGSIRIATGVNALKPLIQISVGEEPDLEQLRPSKNLNCAQRYWIPKQNSIFHSVSGLELINSMPGVEMFQSFFPEQGAIFEKARNHSHRYAHVICTGETREEAILRAENAIAAIQVNQTIL